MRWIWIPIAFALLLFVAYVYFIYESTSGGTGTASFVAANYLGFAAVVLGLLATIFIFRSRVHPPQ